jgi:hypothetical protein
VAGIGALVLFRPSTARAFIGIGTTSSAIKVSPTSSGSIDESISAQCFRDWCAIQAEINLSAEDFRRV